MCRPSASSMVAWMQQDTMQLQQVDPHTLLLPVTSINDERYWSTEKITKNCRNKCFHSETLWWEPGRILIWFEFLFSPSFPGLYKRGWQTAYLQSESQEVPFLVDANVSMMARSIINSPGAVASSCWKLYRQLDQWPMNGERIVLSNVISTSAAVGSHIMRDVICILDTVHVQTMKKGDMLLNTQMHQVVKAC